MLSLRRMLCQVCWIAALLGATLSSGSMGRGDGAPVMFHEVAGLVCMEAEHASYVHLWSPTSGASGTAMRADAAGVRQGGVLRFDIEFAQPGRYALWLLAHKDPDQGRYAGNDIKVFLDSHGESEVNLGSASIFAWHTGLGDRQEPTYWPVETAGRHHLELRSGGEAGFVVDQIVLTRDNANPPSGLGPIETRHAETRQREPGLDENVVLPPAWAFGVIYGKDAGQDEVLRIVQRLIDEDYPIDALWIDSWFWDWGGSGPDGFIDFVGDRQAFPDPQYLWGVLRRHRIKGGIWIWDQILEDGNEDVFREFEEKGFFKRLYTDSSDWHNQPRKSRAGEVDFANPRAAAFWQQKTKPLFDSGLDFLKLDRSTRLPFCRTAFEATQELGLETAGRGFILSQRSGVSDPAYKRYPTKWSGDTKIAWSQPAWSDPRQVSHAGLQENIEMVANPRLYTYDIPFLTHVGGGFKEFDSSDGGDELYVRSCQFSCFNTIYGTFAPTANEPANLPFHFSEQTQRIFRRYMHLRMRLFPYIYSYAHLTRQTGQKMIEGFHNHPTQYLFGDELLVAPVYEKGAQWRTIYLPAGRWIDYWRGKEYQGNTRITYEAPVDRLPILVRAGAIIPMRDYARAIELGSNDPLTLDIYPHGKSSFYLFEDDGLSNDYLTGGFAITEFTAEQGETLSVTLGAALGSYRGRPDARTYILKVNKSKEPSRVLRDGGPVLHLASKAELDGASSGYFHDSLHGTLWIKTAVETARDVVVVIE